MGKLGRVGFWLHCRPPCIGPTSSSENLLQGPLFVQVSRGELIETHEEPLEPQVGKL